MGNTKMPAEEDEGGYVRGYACNLLGSTFTIKRGGMR